MIDEEGERLIDRRGLDHVVIVKHEHDIAQRDEIIQQGRQQHVHGRRLRGLKRPQRDFSNLWRNRLQGRDEINEKTRRVIIAFVQRQPREL